MAFCSGCGANIPSGSSSCGSCGQAVILASAPVTAQPVRATEHTFFEGNGVLVTNTRFVKDNETFAMSGVTSVRSHTIVPSKKGPIILIVLGALVLLGSSQAGAGAAIAGIAMIALGVLWLRSKKDVYYVRLVTSSGERDAVPSLDMAYITKIVAAVNQAIIHRG